MKKDDKQRIATAQTRSLADFDAGRPWKKIWESFKLSTMGVTDSNFRKLVRGTDSMIKRGLLSSPRRMQRWISDIQPPIED